METFTMFKFNDKLYLLTDCLSQIKAKVTVTGKKALTEKSVKALVEPLIDGIPGKSMWVLIANLIRPEEWVALQAVALPEPELEAAQPEEVGQSIYGNPTAFHKAITEAKSQPEIQTLCDGLTNYLFRDKDYIQNTKVQKLSPYSKMFRDFSPLVDSENAFFQTKKDGSLWLRHLYYKYVGLAEINWDVTNKAASEKVLAKLANQAVGLDADHYEQCTSDLVNSQKIWEIAAGLVAASGRRPIEIMSEKVGKFDRADDGKSLLVLAVAKKRGEEIQPFKIPLIGCNLNTFLHKLDVFRRSSEVRKFIDRNTNKDVSDPITKQINRSGIIPVFTWLPAIESKSLPTCSDLRAAWVTVAESKFKSDSQYSLLFRSETLGHAMPTGSPTLNYSKYAIGSATLKPTPEPTPELVPCPIDFTNFADFKAAYLPWKDNLEGIEEEEYANVTAEEIWEQDLDCVLEPEFEPATSRKAYNFTIGEQVLFGDRFATIIEIDNNGLFKIVGDDFEKWVEESKLAASYLEDELEPAHPAEIEVKSGTSVAQVPDLSDRRHLLDFYETPCWMTLLAMQQIPLSGVIGEVCAGHGAIASLLSRVGFKLWTNDIDPLKPADYHVDATAPLFWQQLPFADWIVTNPPYAKLAAPIVENAYNHAVRGIVMFLRNGWDEGCDDRIDFFQAHPPTMKIVMPRYCFRKGEKDNWATDEAPVCIWVWDKKNSSGLTKPLWFKKQKIALFHRNPDETPSDKEVQVEIDKLKKGLIVESATSSIEAIMEPFLKYNELLGEQRWYISQPIVAALAKCRNEKANDWLFANKKRATEANKGLNHTHNRKRNFDREDIYKQLIDGGFLAG